MKKFKLQYNKDLKSNFWKDKKFNSRIRQNLLTIANDFLVSQGIEAPIHDIQLTGSLANYNWTPHSDVDTHILLDFKDIDENEDLVKDALDGKRFVWNTRHDITIDGHEVELYFQDKDEPHTASGLYSLQDGKWLREPKYDPPEVDERDVQLKFDKLADEIERIEKAVQEGKDLKAIEKRASKIKKKLRNMRKEGLQREGEYSVENLTFKKLRHTNYIERLIKAQTEAYDKQFRESHKRETLTEKKHQARYKKVMSKLENKYDNLRIVWDDGKFYLNLLITDDKGKEYDELFKSGDWKVKVEHLADGKWTFHSKIAPVVNWEFNNTPQFLEFLGEVKVGLTEKGDYKFWEEVRRHFGTGEVPEYSPDKRIANILTNGGMNVAFARIAGRILAKSFKETGTRIDYEEFSDIQTYKFIYDGTNFFFYDDKSMYEKASEYVLERVNMDGAVEVFGAEAVKNAINEEPYNEYRDESSENYAEELSNQDSNEFENKLIEELYHEGVLTNDNFGQDDEGNPDFSDFRGEEDELPQLYVNYISETEDGIDWYENNFGENELLRNALVNDHVDLDELVYREISWYTENPLDFADMQGDTYWGEEDNAYLFSFDY